MVKPVLMFGYGNPSRGDDALGPFLLDRVMESAEVSGESVETLTDFQLQIEHAMDMEGRRLALFVDASVSCSAPFEFFELKPGPHHSHTTHAMSPSAVMEVYRTVIRQEPPPSFLLTIKGEDFELGGNLSSQAECHLGRACEFVIELLRNPTPDRWRQLAADA
ncbi:MAG: hydrogenase maturation protease [Gammaproteobacteria bacterium]